MLVAAIGNPENRALSEVVSTAASVELQTAGLSSSVESNGNGGAIDQASAQKAASSLQSDFLLIIAYSEKNSMVEMALSFRGVRGGTTIGHEERRVAFDLNLDSHVSDAVQSLLAEPAVEKAIQNATEVATNARARTSAPRASRSSATNGGAAHGAAPRESSLTATAPVAPVSQHLRFAWSMKGEPLILVGNASNYFRYGAGVSMFAGLRFPERAITLEAGAVAGAAQLYPATGFSQGKVYTFLGGLQSRVGTRASFPIRLSARVSGGAAVIMVLPPSGATEAKTDLFASGGLAASLRIFKTVELGAELGLLAVFEQRYPILAFTPALTVGLP